MSAKRRVFSDEFKREAVKLVVDTGRAISVVAREIDVGEQTLNKWVLYYKARVEAGDIDSNPLGVDERLELEKLREENKVLRKDKEFWRKQKEKVDEENEFLKKASAFFANQSQRNGKSSR